METEKILVELPKFVDQIDLQNLQNGENVFVNQYFSIVINKDLKRTSYCAKFNTPKLRYVYNFVITHEGPRNRFHVDGIEIIENKKHFSFIPMHFTNKMRKISRFEVDWSLQK